MGIESRDWYREESARASRREINRSLRTPAVSRGPGGRITNGLLLAVLVSGALTLAGWKPVPGLRIHTSGANPQPRPPAALPVETPPVAPSIRLGSSPGFDVRGPAGRRWCVNGLQGARLRCYRERRKRTCSADADAQSFGYPDLALGGHHEPRTVGVVAEKLRLRMTVLPALGSARLDPLHRRELVDRAVERRDLTDTADLRARVASPRQPRRRTRACLVRTLASWVKLCGMASSSSPRSSSKSSASNKTASRGIRAATSKVKAKTRINFSRSVRGK